MNEIQDMIEPRKRFDQSASLIVSTLSFFPLRFMLGIQQRASEFMVEVEGVQRGRAYAR